MSIPSFHLSSKRIAGLVLCLLALGCSSKGDSLEVRHHLKVQVIGHQFAWEFIQPGPDGSFGTSDDLRTTNSLVLPEKSQVEFELKSLDVIHGFWVPSLGWKVTVIPGAALQKTLYVGAPGKYKLACAELCGAEHAKMTGWIEVLSSAKDRE